jgi:uncharacterized LabA/DUF88 family protein
MHRVSFFVDGFNLYHALSRSYPKFKWLDLRKLAGAYLMKHQRLSDVFYFTALATWDDEKARRHKVYIRALEVFGVKPVYGQFRKVTKLCPACKNQYSTHEEKETDVNIAMTLYEQAYADTYDTAIIISGDSDLIPVIQAIKRGFPHKTIGVLIPPNSRAKLLKQRAHFYRKIGDMQLSTSQLPDSLTLADGSQIYCPCSWK